jgi:hypothetical protein
LGAALRCGVLPIPSFRALAARRRNAVAFDFDHPGGHSRCLSYDRRESGKYKPCLNPWASINASVAPCVLRASHTRARAVARQSGSLPYRLIGAEHRRALYPPAGGMLTRNAKSAASRRDAALSDRWLPFHEAIERAAREFKKHESRADHDTAPVMAPVMVLRRITVRAPSCRRL